MEKEKEININITEAKENIHPKNKNLNYKTEKPNNHKKFAQNEYAFEEENVNLKSNEYEDMKEVEASFPETTQNQDMEEKESCVDTQEKGLKRKTTPQDIKIQTYKRSNKEFGIIYDGKCPETNQKNENNLDTQYQVNNNNIFNHIEI
ncbi:uncharacterized protein LOC136084561 [Hydra vulgaris]|uniref:uncharacterized protein LOC136084561 n=1 Tax=Hydra vulgaris TaxID=6087 RepID=UPI0032EA65E0